VNDDYGYIYIQLYREYYFPGSTVKGVILLDLFNPIRNKTLTIRVKGKEYPGKFSQQIVKRFMKEPESFVVKSTTNLGVSSDAPEDLEKGKTSKTEDKAIVKKGVSDLFIANEKINVSMLGSAIHMQSKRG
jgi:hypothetical protein